MSIAWLKRYQPSLTPRQLFGLCCLAALLAFGACDPVDVEFRPTSTPTVTRTPTVRATRLPTLTPEPGPALLPTRQACLLHELPAGFHISASGSYTETETEAAGPMVCRISRDSCAIRHMVGNLHPSIVFKEEEEPPFDEEDILMHPSMLLPLSRLSELVSQEWGGYYQLRVTDAYDSLLEHDLNQTDPNRKYSLHFEGRSIDLTTWPIDRNQYPRLCALAHCAGFDWVENEGDHCHASINADSLCLRC